MFDLRSGNTQFYDAYANKNFPHNPNVDYSGIRIRDNTHRKAPESNEEDTPSRESKLGKIMLRERRQV